MLLNTIIWLAMLFYLSGSLAAPSNFDTSSLMARDALGDPMIEAKAAAIGWISNGALHHRVYYIDTAGRIIQWGSDSNIDGGSWSMIEIVPGTIADRGPGIAVDHYVTVDNNVWINVYYTANNTARCLRTMPSGWYKDTAGFDALNLDFLPLAAGHFTINNIVYSRVYGTKATRDCSSLGCDVIELNWDNYNQKWTVGDLGTSAAPVPQSLGQFMAYTSPGDSFEGHLFYYNSNSDGSYGLTQAYFVPWTNKWEYTGRQSTSIPSVTQMGVSSNPKALGSLSVVGWRKTNGVFFMELFLTGDGNLFDIYWPLMTPQSDNTIFPWWADNFYSGVETFWGNGQTGWFTPIVTAVAWTDNNALSDTAHSIWYLPKWFPGYVGDTNWKPGGPYPIGLYSNQQVIPEVHSTMVKRSLSESTSTGSPSHFTLI